MTIPLTPLLTSEGGEGAFDEVTYLGGGYDPLEVLEFVKPRTTTLKYVGERSEHGQTAPLKTRCANGCSEPVMFRCGK